MVLTNIGYAACMKLSYYYSRPWKVVENASNPAWEFDRVAARTFMSWIMSPGIQ
jgi:hypothetical protein